MNIFNYRNYKQFLREIIEYAPNNGRGLRRKFADAAGCQLPYVSHVLNGDYHFNSEQIDGIAGLLKLRQVEHEYLLLLVQHQRAGTASLKKFYKKLVEDMVSKNKTIKSKIAPKDSLSSFDQAKYYSDWTFAAIHMLTTIPDFRTHAQIANKLNLSINKVESVTETLISYGILKYENNKLTPQKIDLHLEEKSDYIHQHHSNWRIKALQSLSEDQDDDLHYSLAFTIHPDDLPKVKEALGAAIKECASIIRPSEAKELAVICIDLFAMT